MGILSRIGLLCLFVSGACRCAWADDPRSVEAPAVAVKVILDGLDNPTDVAISPGGDVFVAESAAGRVLRVVGSKSEPVVTGFPVEPRGEGAQQERVGPLSLAFIDEQTLLVGGGGSPIGEETVRVYTIPPIGTEISAEDTTGRFGPWVAGATAKEGEGDFVSLAAVPDKAKATWSIFVVCQGDGSRGWLGRTRWTGQQLPGSIEPFVATKVATGVGMPTAITLGPVSPRDYLVVSQMGEADDKPDSVIGFYDLQSKQLLLSIETGLRDMTGIAYSTRTPQLYAIDRSFEDPAQGGLFRLDQGFADGSQKIDPVLITRLDKPTSLAFAPNGALFVTVQGSSTDGDSKKSGKLLKIESGL